MEGGRPFDARVLRAYGPQANEAQSMASRQTSLVIRQPSVFLSAQPEGVTFKDSSRDDSKPRKQRSSDRSERVLCLLVVVLGMLIGFLIFITWYIGEGIHNVRDLTRPFVSEAVNHTLSILTRVDEGVLAGSEMAASARGVTDVALPALSHALNQSAQIVDRLERLANNPVLHIQLGNNGMTGR